MDQENKEENNNINIKSENDINNNENNKEINKNLSEIENKEDNQENINKEIEQNNENKKVNVENKNIEDNKENIKINVEQEDKKIEEEKTEKNKEDSNANDNKIKENENKIEQNQIEKNKIKQDENINEKDNQIKKKENKIREEEKRIKEEENNINEEKNNINEGENRIKEEENNIDEEKNANEKENKINEEKNNINKEENIKNEEENIINKEAENKINKEGNIINKEEENKKLNEKNKINEDNNIKEEQILSEEKNIEIKNEDNNQLNSNKEKITTPNEINIKNNENKEKEKEKENQNNKIEIQENINTNKEINNNQIIIEEKEKNEIIINDENSKENKNEIIIESNNESLSEIPEDIRKVKLKESKEDQNKYLVNPEEDKEYKKIISEQMKENNDSDDSDEEEETFPFRFVGDVQKKGEILGLFNDRYLEIDSINGLLKRYTSSKEYPLNPIEIIPIKNLKTLKKLKKSPKQDYYEFNLSYIPENKTKEKTHVYRVRHVECRAKWFESLLKLYKHLVKDEPLPPINKNKLIFIDDQIGISQEIKQNSNKRKKQITSHSVFFRNFKILSELGVGAFGTVFKVQHILTEKIYAMKVMNKNYIIHKKYLSYVVSEFEILKSLTGFPFVIDLHYCFQSANYLFMVIDICPGGDFDNLKYINNLKLFFAELVLAFEHIHKHHVVYRDLKPENILLDPYGHIKVCDFNLAKGGISKHKRATSFCGSPMYLSPEMLEPDGVDQRADIYGIGLILYELVTDKPAFMAPNLDALYNKIKNNIIDFDDPKLKGDMKDLLKKILVTNPDERYTIDEIKKHPYFNDIDFNKVLKREYGPIIIKKKDKNQINIKLKHQNFTKNIMGDKDKDKSKDKKDNEEKKEESDFKEKQKKLDEDKEFSFLDGKISVREMKKDQKRAMKNYVREFYYIKHEDQPQTEEFHLVVNGYIDIDEL